MNEQWCREDDYLAVTMGLVHNKGAGGVTSIGGTFRPDPAEKPSDKREAQWYRRMDRAVGERP